MTCTHPRIRAEVFDQTGGVFCPDCGLAEWCWRDRHCSEYLWNKACENDDTLGCCPKDRHDHCALCEEKF